MPSYPVFVKTYAPDPAEFPVNEKEILRYAGIPSSEPLQGELLRVFGETVSELRGVFSYGVCYTKTDITREDGVLRLPFVCPSSDLSKCLSGCERAVIFCATVGAGLDRRIAAYSRLSPVKALFAQAFGAERAECLCDRFCGEIKAQALSDGFSCTPRFSPGYGDLPLDIQRDIFSLLDCERKIGVTLTDSLLMKPSKSVTAIFGLRKL